MEEEVEVVHPQVPHRPAHRALLGHQGHLALENLAAVAVPAAPPARETQAQPGNSPPNPLPNINQN